MTISIGAAAQETFTVTEADTAIALGSGDVAVLGTPRMIAWCERVTVTALAPGLEPDQTTVGFKIRVDHLAPTPVGATVEVTTEVTEVNGAQVTLEVAVHNAPGSDDSTEVKGRMAGRGSITRVVVDRDRFMGSGGG